jgi:serine/threonine protein kinase
MEQPMLDFGYEILAELGRGTTGVVYKARHRDVRLDRIGALNVLVLGSAPDASLRLKWFLNESSVLAMLTFQPDPALPKIYGVGNHEGQHYFVREFVEGDTLEHLVETKAIGLEKGIGILSAITRAVQRIHDQGIAHRNLHPSNVLVNTKDEAKLIGFGLSWGLIGSKTLAPGITGVTDDVDVRAPQELLGWLFATLGKAMPSRLEAIQQPDALPSLGAFDSALREYT